MVISVIFGGNFCCDTQHGGIANLEQDAGQQ